MRITDSNSVTAALEAICREYFQSIGVEWSTTEVREVIRYICTEYGSAHQFLDDYDIAREDASGRLVGLANRIRQFGELMLEKRQ